MSPRAAPRARTSSRVPGMPPPGARGAKARSSPGPISTRPSVVPPAPPAARVSTPPPVAPPVAPAQLGSVELGVWGVTDVGVARKNNEDCFLVVDLTETSEVTHASSTEVGEKGILLIVSDGMGGENAGEVASAITVASMRDYVQAGLHDDPGEALAASVVHASKKVMEAATAPERAGMGAAVVSVLVRQGIAHVTEIGDCRAYLHRSGALTQLTKDQTHVQVLIDQGLMTPEAAKKSRAKSVVLQAVGKTEDLSVTQRALALREGDRLLLCSDGLTVNVTDAEIAEKLGGQLEGAVESLIALANERGGIDNVTVVIAEVTGALQPSRPEEKVQETFQTVREFEIGGGPPSE
jgi:serine/threonine protein phosphatase PrpC